MLSDARELASDQQLDADVYIVGPGTAGISIARELSGNGASICRSSVRLGIRYSGWPFESTPSWIPVPTPRRWVGWGRSTTTRAAGLTQPSRTDAYYGSAAQLPVRDAPTRRSP